MRLELNVVATAAILALSALTACGNGSSGHDGGGTDTGPGHDGGVDMGGPTDMGGGTDMGLPPGCGDMREPCCRGTLCGPTLTCVTGTCEMPADCGSAGQPCCSGTACTSGLVCMGGSCAAAPSCGSSGEPCCGTDACGAGLVCDRGMCGPTTACGGARQPCCSGTACAAGLSCTSGTCDTAPACGDVRQPCCGASACNTGLACTSGTCDSPTAPPDTCGMATDCNGCTGMASCGFCKDSGTCQEGTSLGPSTGSCTDWAWFSGACVMADPCATASGTCDSCTSMGACGYCRATDECMTGTSTGPTSGSCSDWAWVSSACAGPADPCSAGAPGCGTCTGMASCGFCRDSDTCLTGSSTGPSAGSCTDWVWSSTGCATPDPCASHLECVNCSGASGCGWCSDDDTCRSGTSTGPTGSFCASWAYTTSACVTDPCATHSSDCGGCTAAAGCGYCEEDLHCRSGDTTGPTMGTCNDWRYSTTSCPSTDMCDSNLTCTDCAGATGCGWCATGLSCRSGDSTGPSGGTCTGWTYTTTGC